VLKVLKPGDMLPDGGLVIAVDEAQTTAKVLINDTLRDYGKLRNALSPWEDLGMPGSFKHALHEATWLLVTERHAPSGHPVRSTGPGRTPRKP
jgi:hypothetical protein